MSSEPLQVASLPNSRLNRPATHTECEAAYGGLPLDTEGNGVMAVKRVMGFPTLEAFLRIENKILP